MKWDAIVLAAGEGTRMVSKTPKVLHHVGGQPMIVRVIEALNTSGAEHIHVVISKKIKADLDYLSKIYKNLTFHIQAEPNGTADAVKSVKANLSEYVLICNGDHPLMNPQDIHSFIHSAEKKTTDLTVGILNLKNPGAFGRVILDDAGFAKEIIEAKHCNEKQLKISTVNSGIYFCKSKRMTEFFLEKSKNNDSAESSNKNSNKNSSKSAVKGATKNQEFYLTDIVKFLNDKKNPVSGFTTTDLMCFGVNDAMALNEANQMAYIILNQELMNKGVKFINANATYIEPNAKIEADVLIYPNVYIFGETEIGTGTIIESGVHIKNSKIGPNTIIKAGSYIEGAKILGYSSIGPYAHLRDGSEIHENVKVGNFAEVKNSILKKGVKAGHQCYLGDADIGEDTNIGAGTITCNFAVDGKKYKTIIGKNVFVGSDTQIVPPVTIGDYAVLAAGSTVTKDVESQSLYVTRAKAVTKSNYRKK